MTQEFKKGDRVRILNHPIYAGEKGEFLRILSGKDITANGVAVLCQVKLDEYGIQDFSVSDLEKLP